MSSKKDPNRREFEMALGDHLDCPCCDMPLVLVAELPDVMLGPHYRKLTFECSFCGAQLSGISADDGSLLWAHIYRR